MRITGQAQQHGIAHPNRIAAEVGEVESPDVTRISRGFTFNIEDERLGRILASGNASVSDFINAINRDPIRGGGGVGVWWGLSSSNGGDYSMTLQDSKDFAEGMGDEYFSLDGALAEVDAGNEDRLYQCEVRVVLIAQRPQINGRLWNPAENDFINGELMGNSFLPDGISLSVIEIHYNTGSYAGPDIWRVAGGSGTVTAKKQMVRRHSASAGKLFTANDQRFNQLRQRLSEIRRGLSALQIRNQLAKEFYFNEVEIKAFKSGWSASLKPGRNIEKSEEQWEGRHISDPEMTAWYEGWELVAEEY